MTINVFFWKKSQIVHVIVSFVNVITDDSELSFNWEGTQHADSICLSVLLPSLKPKFVQPFCLNLRGSRSGWATKKLCSASRSVSFIWRILAERCNQLLWVQGSCPFLSKPAGLSSEIRGILIRAKRLTMSLTVALNELISRLELLVWSVIFISYSNTGRRCWKIRWITGKRRYGEVRMQ